MHEPMAVSVSRQDEANPVFWLATQASKKATEAEAESEEKGNLLILPIPLGFWFRLRLLFFLFTLERKAPYASDSNSNYVASGNQP